MQELLRVVDFMTCLRSIEIARGSEEVLWTVAREITSHYARGAEIREQGTSGRLPAPSLHLGIGQGRGEGRGTRRRDSSARAWVSFRLMRAASRCVERASLTASDARYLYSFFRSLVEVWGEHPVASVARGVQPLAFQWQRPVWDLYFAQAGRSVRGLEPEDYVRQMARFGFTHLEVNSLAFPEGLEEGVPGEVYPRFYTYGPALDQFVDSFLNRGLYPKSYLHANLRRLKEACRLAARYGLAPAMTCFEPRSVPERLFAKYPELRGARVDHPFRSFKPRFNLAVSHPVVRRHYRELVLNLLREVPELECLAGWTNDSGAGFEFTRSLYVGANGSAYLVREWSEEDVFVSAAARNVVDFLRLLQESGAELNPRFRVTTRLEPFVAERDRVLDGVGRGTDVEVASLFDHGWESPYGHPRYADCRIGPFTIYNNRFTREESAPMRALAKRGCRTHVMHAHGPANNFEPLLGIPSPWLTYEKLRAMHAAGVEYLAHIGGVAPPASVPWNVNEEIFRRFQFDPGLDIEETVLEIASGWAGRSEARALVRAWRLLERGIRGFVPNPLYFSWGVWYRILVRPLVPDIEKIPERERAYYERFLLATHHNPTRFDLARDVLFQLMTPEEAESAVRRDDTACLPWLERALELLERESRDGAEAVLADQRDRARALRCWCTTYRNVAEWIVTVHGYLRAKGGEARAAFEGRLQEMIDFEVANACELLELWESSATVFMAISREAETTFVYDGHFGQHLCRKIALMERYRHERPHIDSGVMWRVARLPREFSHELPGELRRPCARRRR
ncbi:MAG: hypothetical protein AB1486_19570 [Planctomycetota bacterium]